MANYAQREGERKRGRAVFVVLLFMLLFTAEMIRQSKDLEQDFCLFFF